MSLETRRCDLPKFDRVWKKDYSPAKFLEWCDDVTYDGDKVSITVDEANYAWYNELVEAAKLGAVFMGWHGDGCGYNRGVFCAIDKSYLELETSHDGAVAATLDEDGNTSAEFRRTFKEFKANEVLVTVALKEAEECTDSLPQS